MDVLALAQRISEGYARTVRVIPDGVSMRFYLVFALTTLLIACPDPTAGPGAAPADAPHGGGAPPADAQAAGKPPSGPPDGGPGSTGFQVKEGEGVTLSGTFTYSGEKTGAIRLDFLEVAEGAGGPKLAHVATLDAYGEWSLEAPKDFGTVRLMAFIDQNGDGPSQDDPALAWPDPIVIAGVSIPGIDLVLTDEAKLHDLAPNGPNAQPAGPPQPTGEDLPTGASPDADKSEADAAEEAGDQSGSGSDEEAKASE
jgi:hypothetical protein